MQPSQPNALIYGMKYIAFFITLSVLSFIGSISNAQVAPDIDWKVIEQEHAVWIYDSRQKDLALQYSKSFQKVFPQLQKLFVEFPTKTTFVISDHTDSPNGSATVFPYPLITIFPVIPLPTSPIGETDDSFFEILCHEYTHIMNLYPVHGGMRLLHTVFGSLIHPNMMLPRWYVEGLAVYTESYFNPKGGRLRSQNFEGVVRAISAKKEWNKYSIDELNEFIPDWMGGRRAYLLGGAFVHHLVETSQIESLHQLNQSSSRRLPFFLNGWMENQTGQNVESLLQDTYKYLQSQSDQQQQVLQTAPITQGQRLPQSGNMNHHPLISPDGKYLAFISSHHNIPSSIHILTRSESGDFDKNAYKVNPPTDTFGIEHIAWSPDSKTLAFNLIQPWKRFSLYSDIHFFDIESRQTRQITHGARAGDILFAENGKGLFFIQNTPGNKQLSYYDLQSNTEKILYTPVRLGSNLWSLTPSGSRLLFIEQNSEKRVLKAYDIASGNIHIINESSAPTSITSTPLGLVWSSAQSGVDNLYLSPTEQLSQKRTLTNSMTRILDGTIDPHNQKLYYSEQKEDGMYLYSTPKQDWEKITVAPRVEPLLKIPTPPPTDMSLSQEKSLSEEKDFSAWPYLYPRHWMPYGYILDGGFALQASAVMSDPLGKNTISLGAEWDSLTQKTGGSVSYVNRSTPVALGVSAAQVYRYIYDSKSSLKDTGASASARSFIPGLSQRWTLGLEIDTFTTELLSSSIRRTGPAIFLSYNNSRRLGLEISPEHGTSLSLSHQSFIKEWGNIGFEKTNASGRFYFSKWLPERHVLFSQINATYAPQLNRTTLFTSTIGGNFISNTLIPPFLMRGYPTGTLLGNNVMVGNLEYRFPIKNIYSGWGTTPVFFKQLHGSLVADTVSLDGLQYSFNRNSYVRSRFGDQWHMGYGAEAHLSCTLGYYLPVTFTFGIYFGENKDIAKDAMSTFFSFSL